MGFRVPGLAHPEKACIMSSSSSTSGGGSNDGTRSIVGSIVSGSGNRLSASCNTHMSGHARLLDSYLSM